MTPDLLIHAKVALPEQPTHTTFAALLKPRDAEDARQVVLRGPAQDGDWAVTLGQLHSLSVRLHDVYAGLGIEVGQRVVAVRLPQTSEVGLAALLLATVACGRSVAAPMVLDLDALPALLEQADARALIADWSSAPELPIISQARELAAARGVLTLDLAENLSIHAHMPADALDATLPERAPTREAIILDTSGTTGAPRHIAYDEAAWCRMIDAWQVGGLLDDAVWGDPLVPMLCHTMGLRAVVLAAHTRRAALCIPPEWLDARPYQVVRALMKHPPAHITCGPALLHLFAHYLQRFPMLRERLRGALRAVVSSGAGYDAGVAGLLGLDALHNALGTTETQQITSTLMGGRPPGVGAPLPGVTLGVVWQDEAARVGTLWARVPWGSARALGASADEEDRADAETWRCVGDQVRVVVEDDGEVVIHIEGRAEDALLSTGMGWLLDAEALRQEALTAAPWLRDVAVLAHPAGEGALALAFTGELDPDDAARRGALVEALAAAQELRLGRRDEVARRFTRVSAVGLLPGAPPMRGPGKLDARALQADHAALLDALADPLTRHPDKLEIPPPRDDAAPGWPFAWPRRGELLRGLGLDWRYEGGRGDLLDGVRPDGERLPVLDLVGGYGANLLGHRHPEVIEAMTDALAQGVPMLDQGSARGPAGALAVRLARRLSAETGRRHIVSLSNTGAEAVEVALKHAVFAHHQRLERVHEDLIARFGGLAPEKVRACISYNEAALARAPLAMLALRGAFHGKTLGALHALHDPAQRAPFERMLGLQTVFLPHDGGEAAQAALAEALGAHAVVLRVLELSPEGQPRFVERAWTRLVATLAEPILGEGGVWEVPRPWLMRLAGLDVPLILDEIQCGLGRAGTFLASEGVPAQAIVLGKSLGGGVAKISAVAFDAASYEPGFDDLRGDTFSGDRLSAAAATRALEIIDRERLWERARVRGDALRDAVRQVQQRHPRVITAVRGRGLMLGVELAYPNDPPSVVLATMAREGLGYLAAAYLLNQHQLRVMPTTSAPDVLRLEPSAYLGDAQIAQVVAGLDALCEALETSNLFELVIHCVGHSADLNEKRAMARQFLMMPQAQSFQIMREAPAPGARRVVFLHNPVHLTKLLLADAPTLALLTSEQRLELIDRFIRLLELAPMPSFGKNLFGGRVWMGGVTMAASPEALDWLKRRGELGLVRRRIQEAVGWGAAQGADVVALGGHTSIVTDSGQALLPPEGVQLVSGNAMTAAVVWRQLLDTCAARGVRLDDPERPAQVALIGATGNIGGALAHLLAGDPALSLHLRLVGRAGSTARLERIRAQLAPSPHTTVTTHDSLDALPECDAMLLCVSAPHPLVHPEHVAPDRPVVIADVSEPHAVAPGCAEARPQATVLHAGTLRLPQDEDFVMSAHTDPGEVFACAAEALLLALHPDPALRLTGPIGPDAVRALDRLATREGLL